MLARIPDLACSCASWSWTRSTEGKDPEPLEWFRSELSRRSAG